jgi:hypothetical protein
LPNYESSEEKGFILKPYGFGEKWFKLRLHIQFFFIRLPI